VSDPATRRTGPCRLVCAGVRRVIFAAAMETAAVVSAFGAIACSRSTNRNAAPSRTERASSAITQGSSVDATDRVRDDGSFLVNPQLGILPAICRRYQSETRCVEWSLGLSSWMLWGGGAAPTANTVTLDLRDITGPVRVLFSPHYVCTATVSSVDCRPQLSSYYGSLPGPRAHGPAFVLTGRVRQGVSSRLRLETVALGDGCACIATESGSIVCAGSFDPLGRPRLWSRQLVLGNVDSVRRLVVSVCGVCALGAREMRCWHSPTCRLSDAVPTFSVDAREITEVVYDGDDFTLCVIEGDGIRCVADHNRYDRVSAGVDWRSAPRQSLPRGAHSFVASGGLVCLIDGNGQTLCARTGSTVETGSLLSWIRVDL